MSHNRLDKEGRTPMTAWTSKAAGWISAFLRHFPFHATPPRRDLPPLNEEISRWVDEGGSGSDPRVPHSVERRDRDVN